MPQVTVQMETWMTLITDAVTKVGAYRFGKSPDGKTVVVLTQGGGARYWCETHQRIYALNAACPDCIAIDITK